MSAPGTSRPGGRTARTAEAVFAAAVDELAERGYDDTSIETIAARAGVHKTTLYRRWHSKAELIAHVLKRGARAMIPVPDTGRAETDFRDLARSVQDVLSSPRGAAITRALLAGSATSPEIRHLMQQYWAARLAAISVIIDRAVARGELPAGTDPEAAMRALAAPLYYQLLVTFEPITRPDADQSAAAALAAARAHAFTRPPQASAGEHAAVAAPDRQPGSR